MTLKHVALSTLLGSLVVAAGMSTSIARDTDIYFTDSSAATVLIKPNLMLTMDTTGSLNEVVSGVTQSRLDVLKGGMLTLLDNLSNMNVGLMRFSGNPTSSPVLYPVADLDAPVTDTGRLVIPIQDSPDDAQQTGTTVAIGDQTLTLGSNIVGLRFRNAYIPQLQNVASAITSAKLVFRAGSGGNNNSATIRISADASDNALVYSTAASNISGRTQTSATVDWAVGTSSWTAGNHYESPDISAVVQAVVTRAGWCRGNALAFRLERTSGSGSRVARAYDTYQNNSFSSPTAYLVVNYDPSKIQTSSSCDTIRVISRISQSSDDAEERVSNGNMDLTSTLQLPRSGGNNQYVGLRFQNVAVPQGATIVSATIEFEVDSTATGTVDLTIRGQNSTSPASFSTTSGDISGRPLTTKFVAWNGVPNNAVNSKLTTPNLASIVEEIVAPAGWTSGNAMVFRIERSGSGTNSRNVESLDSEPAAAPLLRITYAVSATTPYVKTVRDELQELIVGLKAEGGTGIVDALYEAARYYRGEAADYGLTRGDSSATLARWSRVSHVASLTGESVNRVAGCTDDDLNAAACATESLTGSPVYTSPISAECQTSHIIVLTDGDTNVNASAAKIRTMTGATTCSGSGAEACGETLATFLSTQDQSGTYGGASPQTVRTHTIGFGPGISSGGLAFLNNLATAGGGGYNTAQNEYELVNAFQGIINDVLAIPSSFVSPSLSVNAFNRLYNRDEVYFSLFKPALGIAWPGNLKKYTLCSASTCTFGEVMDAASPPQPAIETAAGANKNKIKTTAISYWSNATDGREVQVGGAGAEIATYSSRRVYTYTGTSDTGAPDDLSAATHRVVTSNAAAALNQAALGASSSAERDAIINWMRGQDIEDEDSDGVVNEDRWRFADALHSRPATITYGGTAASPVIKIVIGTNEGGIRMIDAASGEEDWYIYLPEFLDDQRALKDNSNGVHFIGVDGSPTTRIVDNNNNGIIEPANGDKVQLFVGMRRGGRDIYAFDLTPDAGTVLTTSSAIGSIKPKFMWRIKGGGGSFGQLGQTWSRPLLANVWVKCLNSACSDGDGSTKDSELKTVLMFAGGYDPSFDDTMKTGTDSYGNAIYMVDPDTGARQWWAGGTGSGADLELANMYYSIPSDLTLYDSNSDGAVDRVFVGDTRGQLWRIDLDNQIDPSASSTSQRNGNTAGYVLADIGCKGGVRSNHCTATSNQDRRSFFYPPDVAQVRDETFSSTSKYDYVTIATGDREDPLDKKTQVLSQTPVNNRIYALRDTNIKLGPPATTPSAIVESALYDASVDVLGNTASPGFATALTNIKASKGWFVDLKKSTTPQWIGEKSLAKTTIYAGVLYVTTFTPAQSSGAAAICADPQEGTATEWALNLFNASGTPPLGNSRMTEVGYGIPSELVIVIRESGASGLIGTSGGAGLPAVPKTLPRFRTYWSQQ